MIDVVDLLIIGSGISGLSAALEAKKYFKNVLIIDKGYHSGGRICSKKINSFCFNHGAPYINKSSKRFNLGFSNFINKIDEVVPFKVSSNKKTNDSVLLVNPNMRSLFNKHLNKLNINQKTKVLHIIKQVNYYQIKCDNGKIYKSKKIIVTAPAPQTADLIKDVSPEMLKYINKANFSQCISVLLGFNQSFDLPLNSFFYDEIGGICSLLYENHNSKYSKNSSLVIRMSDKWSQFHFNMTNDEIINHCLSIISKKFNIIKINNVVSTYCHKWRYSQVTKRLPSNASIVNKEKNLGVAGDWTLGPTIEDAYNSGKLVVQKILEI